MSREYAISSGGITLANQAVTLLFCNPGTDDRLEILRVWVGQSANATSAQQRIQFVTQVDAEPTLTGATPSKLHDNDPVSQIVSGTAGAPGTCGINASAEGAGAKTIMFEPAPFNVVSGFLWVPAHERILLGAAGAAGFGVYFPVAAATLTNWAFGLIYREL